MEVSKVTLQPLPTPEKLISEMLLLYMEECGHGDFFDAYTAIKGLDLKETGYALYSKMEEMSDEAMIAHGRCPKCGGKLIRKSLAATKWEPGAEWVECQDCHDEIAEVG